MNAEEAIHQVVVKAKKAGKPTGKFPSVSSSTPDPTKSPKVRKSKGADAVRILGSISREPRV
jgi:hypothetical protein